MAHIIQLASCQQLMTTVPPSPWLERAKAGPLQVASSDSLQIACAKAISSRTATTAGE